MASRGVTSSAKRLAILRRSSSRGLLAPSKGGCLHKPPAVSGAFTPHFPDIKYPIAVFSRSSSSNPKSNKTSEIAAAGGSDAPAVSNEDHLALAKPLDFDMASKVEGQESQMVTFELQPGQVIRVSHSLLTGTTVS